MPLSYAVPQAPTPPPPIVDKTDPCGEDVSLRGGDLTVTTGGDWGALTGPLVARQSVEREAVASPGDMPRRPNWGMGIRDALQRNANKDARDRMVSTARRRVAANPRIESVQDVSARQRTDVPGATTLTIVATVSGQPMRFEVASPPPRKVT